jgi:hypothetical protein
VIWTGLLAGGLLGLLVEFATLRARLRARRHLGSPLPTMLGGFLLRFALLVGGGALGALAGTWSPVAFLLAAATVLLLGECAAFALLRRPPARDDSQPSP